MKELKEFVENMRATSSSLEKVEILCDNQDRLRCSIGEYQEVFNNFSDLDYIAIKPKVVKFDDMDDDIPF